MSIVTRQSQMEQKRFAFRSEKKLATVILPAIKAVHEVFQYLCACGSRMRKPAASSSGLGKFRCPVCRGKKVGQRERVT